MRRNPTYSREEASAVSRATAGQNKKAPEGALVETERQVIIYGKARARGWRFTRVLVHPNRIDRHQVRGLKAACYDVVVGQFYVRTRLL